MRLAQAWSHRPERRFAGRDDVSHVFRSMNARERKSTLIPGVRCERAPAPPPVRAPRVGAIGLVSKRAVSDRRFSGELLTLGDRMRRRARVVNTDMIEDESVIFPRKTKHWRTVFREGAHGAHNGTSTPCGRRQERTVKRPFGRPTPDNFG